jgi:catechol 2,3-dioxygenase-like lactoylglutathione lyase family enzyme
VLQCTYGRRTILPNVPFALVAVDHIQLAIPAGREHEGTARTFYGGLLGLPEVPKPPELAGRGGLWFASALVQVHLGVDPQFRPAGKAHPAFRVRGLAALVERLRDAGVAVVQEPMPRHQRVYVADPFGNRIELLEPDAAGG